MEAIKPRNNRKICPSIDLPSIEVAMATIAHEVSGGNHKIRRRVIEGLRLLISNIDDTREGHIDHRRRRARGMSMESIKSVAEYISGGSNYPDSLKDMKNLGPTPLIRDLFNGMDRPRGVSG